MTTLLLRNAEVLLTLDAERREIRNGGLFARDGVVEQVGPSSELPSIADQVIDANGQVVLPGLINTHHHLYQTITRAIPAGQDAPLFNWLQALYPLWNHLQPEDVKLATKVGIAELLLSGCTTTAEHLYLFPNGLTLDDSIEAAMEMGIRFHPTRGSMSLGESNGGLPPDSLVEREEDILEDCLRLIDSFHDPSPMSRLRISLAPCSPFAVTRDLMRETAVMARDKGVGLHSHLAENQQDIDHSQEKFGQRPGAYAEDLGWIGPDVWHAHCVHLDHDETMLFAASGTGIAHCPSSNMRLGSGIAPLRLYRDKGVSVGLGVDGSASNDAAHLLGEARQALLLQRVKEGAAAFSVREALEVACLGGAKVLGRPTLGALAPGMAADITAFNLNDLAFSGGLGDPVAALLLCRPERASLTIVAGELLVEDGRLTRCDLPPLIEAHNKAAKRLLLEEPIR